MKNPEIEPSEVEIQLSLAIARMQFKQACGEWEYFGDDGEWHREAA